MDVDKGSHSRHCVMPARREKVSNEASVQYQGGMVSIDATSNAYAGGGGTGDLAET